MVLAMRTTMYAIKSVKGRHVGKYYSWKEKDGPSWGYLENCELMFSRRDKTEDFMGIDRTFIAWSTEDKCVIVEVQVDYYKSSKV